MVAYISVNHWLQGRGSIRGGCFSLQAIAPVSLDMSRYKQFRAELYKAISDDKKLLITLGQKYDAENIDTKPISVLQQILFPQNSLWIFQITKISKSKILQQIHLQHNAVNIYFNKHVQQL